jgi:histone H3/H4
MISVASIKRIVKAAGGKRIGTDLVQKNNSIVRILFQHELVNLLRKVTSVALYESKKTILVRHVKQVGLILGDFETLSELPTVAIAPIKRYIKGKTNMRLNDDALKLIIGYTLQRVILAVRSGVGLAAHSDNMTVRSRDVQNARFICQNYPK